jgi:hypothetical protein
MKRHGKMERNATPIQNATTKYPPPKKKKTIIIFHRIMQ